MDQRSQALIDELRSAGLSREAIDAAWPTWWSDEAAKSPSAQAELRFALSRNLGLSPQSLLGERVEFVWDDSARFKNLTANEPISRGALASFGVAVARLLVRATPARLSVTGVPAEALRSSVIKARGMVDLVGLLSTCWSLGVPVIHLRVFPLPAKSMRAMVVEVGGRHAVLLGRDANYPAPVLFTLAHEVGHAALGHTAGEAAIVDVGDFTVSAEDNEERDADTYAMQLLTGESAPAITVSTDRFSAQSLAQQCLSEGPPRGIEPGTLALCVGHVQNNWAVANAALRVIYTESKPVWQEVNKIATQQLDWNALSYESANYVRALLGGHD
ncbi:MAG: hypothetical protein GY873_37505 [Bosea sp.]|uniref:ImmA/IrrE family metallo-endopeptidase n=1 Tax=Bosea sp. (in: a-proteobacteria) TaxID=1871050 RepID=UPI002391E4D4|nr:hypothetical protein [Bosea sp. (in: a-proteobacteria)]MCP4739899.1 hypothetical protein [Bosea sp. (in: a-proteobacteria)]